MVVLRVRTKAGVWRFEEVDLQQKLSTFLQRVENEKKITVKVASLQQNLSESLPTDKTLKQLGLKHGSMLYV